MRSLGAEGVLHSWVQPALQTGDMGGPRSQWPGHFGKVRSEGQAGQGLVAGVAEDLGVAWQTTPWGVGRAE